MVVHVVVVQFGVVPVVVCWVLAVVVVTLFVVQNGELYKGRAA